MLPASTVFSKPETEYVWGSQRDRGFQSWTKVELSNTDGSPLGSLKSIIFYRKLRHCFRRSVRQCFTDDMLLRYRWLQTVAAEKCAFFRRSLVDVSGSEWNSA